MDSNRLILLTGATGHVGGRILRTLEARGWRVRCLTRRPLALAGSPPTTEVVRGGILDEPFLREALRGADTAYYLVPSLEEEDRALGPFGRLAREAGVRRIITLSGPRDRGRGDLLRESGVPVIEFRASILVGAGSLPFEVARRLVEKLPVIAAPRWMRTKTQPISSDDAVEYLLEALEADLPAGGVFEVGGMDRDSFAGLLREYARRRGVRRLLVPVPFHAGALSAAGLALAAPRQSGGGRRLVQGLRGETVVTDPAAERVFKVRPCGIAEAVRRATVGLPPDRPALTGAKSLGALVLCVLAALAVGAAGKALSQDGVREWYPGLLKPGWTPSSWVFAPLLTTLTLLMGVAAWRVWVRDGLVEGRLALGVFALQLLLGAAWSGIFFGLRRPDWAFAANAVLAAAILATAALFRVRSRLAAWLLAPSALWVLYDAALNLALWKLNG